MNKRIYLLLLWVGLMAAPSLHAQTAGYMGRRFMVKANLVNGGRPLYFGGELEYTLHRRVTLGVGGGYQMGNYKQLYYTQHYGHDYEDYLYYKKHLSGRQAHINSVSFFGQLKLFPFNRLKSAPDGFYFGIKAGGGFANINSKPGMPIKVDVYPHKTDVPESFNIKSVPFMSYEFGPGLQKVFWGRLVVDLAAFFNITSLNFSGSQSSKTYTATVARQFGPNTFWLGPTGTDNTAPNGYINEKDVHPRYFTTNFGMSVYGKIGILLF